MHKTTGNWKLGLTLSLITVLMWGTLPIALKGVLTDLDSYTITWYRFMVSVLLVGAILMYQNKLPDGRWLKNKINLKLFIIVIAGISSNYILYLLGLDLTTPAASQIIIQLAPLLLLLGGIFLFKEKFSLLQWLGILFFVAGLFLFFNHKIEEIILKATSYRIGVIFVIIAAVTWAAYALAQKQLLRDYSSQQIMFITYVAATIIFLPFADILSVSSLSETQWWLLVYCCINTIIAYGCFAESLQHWEASRVSAVITLTPVATILFGFLTHYYFPNYVEHEALNQLSLLGAGTVVVGSLLTSLARRK